ncbi:MAG TPA: ABC transporter substrate-binding protein [Burkholderiales bacterium]|nr:ABC transporter substrate-binding protein [Burkholderiales bacterium]
MFSSFVRLTVAALAMVSAVAAHAADPIKIGLVNETTGPNAEAGSYTVNGVRLAVDEINAAGGIMGRPIELKMEDNQSTNPGTVLAYSKLIGEGGITAIVGPIRSTQIQAASPTIQKGAVPAMVGGTDPSLTKVNNPWIFRMRPNDSYSSRVIADFGVNSLKLKKWAIVHSTDAFGSGGMKALTEALKGHGVTPVLVQGYTNNSQDFTPVVLAIKKSGADVLATYMTNSQDVGIFAKQLRQLGVTVPWIGSPSVVTDTAMKLAGPALYGTYAVADFNAGSSSEAKAFAEKYRARYKLDADVYSSWAYDALFLLKRAIETAKSTEPEKVRNALLGVCGWKGVEGTYCFDKNGDGLRGYNVVRNENGKIAFIKHIDFKD